MKHKSKCVLDASALMALINNEEGADLVEAHITGGVMSVINFTEVLTKMLEQGIPEKVAMAVLDNFGIELIAFETQHILLVSLLRLKTKQQGLSLADRVCLSLGLQLKLPVVTTDKIWAKLNIPGLDVVLAR